MNRTTVAQVVAVRSEVDAVDALSTARERGLRVSIAGSRHSMGGQTFAAGHLVLDMRPMKALSLDEGTGILTAGAGATWREVQQFVDPRGRAVWVMQSDNVFTIGGTLSVNAHGWQAGRPPVASTVESFRLLLPSGEVKTCSRGENADLFSGALGGYGLIGVILEARLRTVPNELYRKSSWFFPSSELAARFRRHVGENPAAALTYARLSVDANHFLTEAGLHVYERAGEKGPLPPMTDEALVEVKREVFRASERSDAGKRRRWLIEKRMGPLLERGLVTRNTAMNPDIQVLWPTDPARRDILHEYFVPLDRLQAFVDGARRLIPRHGQNLLNVTLRDVRRDDDTILSYARQDVVALVLLFSQDATPAADEKMRGLTSELVELALGIEGSFYLPYRLHYTAAQLHRAYPRLDEFLALKARYDPEARLHSRFYDHIAGGS
jgi:FAD/FMN-containing dehydrogenase